MMRSPLAALAPMRMRAPTRATNDARAPLAALAPTRAAPRRAPWRTIFRFSQRTLRLGSLLDLCPCRPRWAGAAGVVRIDAHPQKLGDLRPTPSDRAAWFA